MIPVPRYGLIVQSENLGGQLIAIAIVLCYLCVRYRKFLRSAVNKWKAKRQPSTLTAQEPSKDSPAQVTPTRRPVRNEPGQFPSALTRPKQTIQRYLVVDFETTGVTWPYYAVEVAWIELDSNFREVHSQSSLIRPPIPIPSEATNIHGISNEDVADAPSLDEFFIGQCNNPFESEHIGFIAHNAPYDYRLFKRFCRTAELLCTLAAARRLYPNSTNHKLTTLVSNLGLKDFTAHRAMGDARSCLELLHHLRDATDLDISGLFDFGNPFRVLSSLPFGKHRGVPLSAVPQSYLDWLSNKVEVDDPIFPTLRAELTRRSTKAR